MLEWLVSGYLYRRKADARVNSKMNGWDPDKWDLM